LRHNTHVPHTHIILLRPEYIKHKIRPHFTLNRHTPTLELPWIREYYCQKLSCMVISATNLPQRKRHVYLKCKC